MNLRVAAGVWGADNKRENALGGALPAVCEGAAAVTVTTTHTRAQRERDGRSG
eukprot:COSAG03_NODE_957_length_5178_cov_6.712603_4_plen_53_part_00